jgi:hypothetical protein
MPLNFPTSPSTNDEYSFGGKTWVYNGAGWALKSIPLTTANVNESGNLYYTDARVYANVELIGYASNTYVNTRLATKANVADKLNVFASTTSSELASVISDETGSGSLVFATSPTFDGTPQVPTAANVTSNAMVASTLFVKNAIANLIDTAPATLDTLNELAAALNDDPNFATTTATLIGSSFNQANAAFAAANTKVATVAGVTDTTISNAALLDGIKVVDGVGSGLDADLLDGLAGGGSGSYALKANNLSVFASTTSAQLAGVISDETGSGNLVFSTSPTLVGTPQAPTAAVGTANAMIATTAFAANATNLSSGVVAPARVVGSYTNITGVGTIAAGTWQGSSISTTYTDAKITSITASTPITANAATGAVALSHANSGVVAGTYGNAKIIPVVTVNATGHVTGVSNVSIEAGSSVTVSNTAPVSATEGDLYWDEDLGRLFIYYNDGDSAQWVDASPSGGGGGGVANVAGATGAVSNTQILAGLLTVDGVGSGLDADTLDGIQGSAFALDTDLTTANVTEVTNLYFTNTRAIGAFTGGSGMTIASNGLLTVSVVGGVTSVAGATGAVSNAQLLAGLLTVDGVGSGLDADVLDGLAGGGSGFYALKANNLSVFASTTSAQLAGVISDETGSGSLVFATSPTLAGTPQAPTAAIGTANAMIATTAFASNASALASGIVNPSRISGSYTGITGVGTIAAGTWQGSSISTTYTDAKLTAVAATSPIVTSASTGSITLSHAASGVAATTYGGATNIPVLTVDSTGHITVAANVAISAGGLTVANTASTSTHYVLFTNSTSGSVSTGNISIPSLYFVPSTGSLNATEFNSLSDATLKEDINPISNYFELLEKINPVSFKWKETNKSSYGVIAQEIEQLLPSLVSTNDKGIKSVSYIPLISILISCVKELKQEINNLKKNNNGN